MDLDMDLTENRFFGGETDAQFQERVDDRNRYVAQCNKGKQEFAQEIGKSKAMLLKLAHHDFTK
jgi:hypothetical protein